MSSLFLMVTITDRRSTDAFLQLYQQRGVDEIGRASCRERV